MTAPELEILEALDWSEIQCQCAHHHKACPNRATHVVHVHALHACNEPGLQFGNRVELRCYECLLKLQAEVHFRVKRLCQWGIGECDSRSAPVADMRDVVRDWSEL